MGRVLTPDDIVAGALRELNVVGVQSAIDEGKLILADVNREILEGFRYPWALQFFQIGMARASTLGELYRAFTWPPDCIGRLEILWRDYSGYYSVIDNSARRVGDEVHVMTSLLHDSREYYARGVRHYSPVDASDSARGGEAYRRLLELSVALRLAPNHAEGREAVIIQKHSAAQFETRQSSGINKLSHQRMVASDPGMDAIINGDYGGGGDSGDCLARGIEYRVLREDDDAFRAHEEQLRAQEQGRWVDAGCPPPGPQNPEPGA